MAIRTATYIIKKDVNNDILNNIIDISDPKVIWEQICVACAQVSQSVVYFIL